MASNITTDAMAMFLYENMFVSVVFVCGLIVTQCAIVSTFGNVLG